MPIRAVIIAAIGAFLAGSAWSFSDSDLGRGTTPPDWAARPSSDQTDHVYPELANDMSVGGHVMLKCRIDSRGLVERCRVLAETPLGFRFGDAALRLTPMFRFRPAMTITGPMPSDVNIPIRFVPPPDDIRRAIPFMALLAAFTTWLRWYRGRNRARSAISPGRTSEASG